MAKAAKKVVESETEEQPKSEARKIDFKRQRYEFVLEAATPIAHHSENIGNQALIMRRQIRTPHGFTDVPIITGDTMRHGMREAAAYAILDACGMLSAAGLTEGALRLLFAGGMVTGKGDASVVRLDQYHELCDLVPSMALFGGCCDNRVIPGRLAVEDATLICEETSRFVPEWAAEFARTQNGQLDDSRAHIEEEQRVRMDPTLSPEKRLLLSGGARDVAERRLAASETAHEESNAIAVSETKSSMMPRRFERVCQGSLFSWAVEATTYNDLDVDTLHVACAAFLANARVGGKRGTGHGLIRAVAGQGIAISRPRENMYPINALAIAPKVGELFRAHVRERADRIRAWARGVNA